MNIRGRLERAAERSCVTSRTPPCALCALIAKAAARVYGADFEPPAHTPEACAKLRHDLLKVYGGQA